MDTTKHLVGFKSYKLCLLYFLTDSVSAHVPLFFSASGDVSNELQDCTVCCDIAIYHCIIINPMTGPKVQKNEPSHDTITCYQLTCLNIQYFTLFPVFCGPCFNQFEICCSHQNPNKHIFIQINEVDQENMG